MPRAGRTSMKSSFNFSCEWLLLLLTLLLPSFTTAQLASSLYNRQFYDHNQQQVQQGFVYPDAPVTYNQQYPAAGHSVWSSAPIVVNDEANSLQLEEQQQQDRHYLPINYYNNRETDRQRSNWMNDNASNNYKYNYNYNVPTTRAANHNYNNVPGYFYHTTQQPQSQPRSQQEAEQRELLAVADSRREEEQIVRIGGSRSLSPIPIPNNNNNYYFEAPQSLRRRDFEAKYAKHNADYLRKYPQRLQPLYNTGPSYVDK